MLLVVVSLLVKSDTIVSVGLDRTYCTTKIEKIDTTVERNGVKNIYGNGGVED